VPAKLPCGGEVLRHIWYQVGAELCGLTLILVQI
jgi:hypothetical protein